MKVCPSRGVDCGTNVCNDVFDGSYVDVYVNVMVGAVFVSNVGTEKNMV